MKTNFIFLTLIVIFLVACTGTAVRNYDQVQDIVDKETSIVDADPILRSENGIVIEYEKVETDIVIEGTQLYPDHITIPLGNTTEIVFQNKDNFTYLLEIPMFKSEKQRTINPYESVILKLTPSLKGIVAIKLGGFILGTIIVE